HVIVEQKSGAGDGHAAAVAIVQGISDGDCVSFLVHDAVVRGVGSFVSGGETRGDLLGRRGAIGTDCCSTRIDICGRKQRGDGDVYEIGIAQIFAAVGKVATHHLRYVVIARGGACTGFFVTGGV